ncbi:MAG: alpha/beta fold hydrolase [Roseovarius sp.]
MPRGERAGFPTYWTSFGQGPRKALMIHCSLAHSGSWGGVARHLSGALHMTAFDMPGHGRSGAWDNRDEYQRVTSNIAATFCDEPLDVVGHSFGATVALRLAIERPELVRSLVLIEPVFFAVAIRDHPELYITLQALFAPFAAALKAEDRAEAAKAFSTIWGDGTAWAALPDAQKQALADQIHLIEAGHEALYDDPGGLLDDGVLQGLDKPVQLIEGTRSPFIIPAIHEGLAARLPRAERTVIVGAGHMAPITHAAQVSDAMLRFLRLGWGA